MHFERILNSNSRTKTVSFLTTTTLADGSTAPSVVLLEKQAFDMNQLAENISSMQIVEEEASNDIYKWFQIKIPSERIRMQTICPATAKHIAKYSKQSYKKVIETALQYESKVKPFIESIPKERLDWMRNIWQGKSEQDKILFKHNDFMILPDGKWNGVNLSDLYLLVILADESLKSIRDLNDSHLLLLKSIQSSIATLLKEKYSLSMDDVRCYFHYHPTYYWLHVHVTHVEAEYPGMLVGQSHLLEDVIDNIENIDSSYYAKKTITFVLGVEHEVYKLLQ